MCCNINVWLNKNKNKKTHILEKEKVSGSHCTDMLAYQPQYFFKRICFSFLQFMVKNAYPI